MRCRVLAICVAVLTAACAAAGPDREAVEAALEGMGTPTEGRLLVAVGKGDRVVAATSPAGEGDPATEPFRIGSLAKPFTAAVVLTLVEEGAVELDRPASDYVERLPLPDGITVRHLLSHRSGLADHTQAAIYGDEEQGESRAWSPEELYGFVAEKAPVFEPGTGFEYGNVGYLVAAVLVEEVASQPFHHVLRERILEPLGLESTYLAHFEDGPKSAAGFAAVGSGQVQPADFDFTAIDTTLWSAGAMVSTASDLHRFAAALAEGEVVDQSLVEEMLTPVGAADSGRRHPAVPHEYGLGVALFDTPETVFGAFGNVPGYHALLLHAPDGGRTVVYSSSNELFTPPVGRLLDLLLGEAG